MSDTASVKTVCAVCARLCIFAYSTHACSGAASTATASGARTTKSPRKDKSRTIIVLQHSYGLSGQEAEAAALILSQPQRSASRRPAHFAVLQPLLHLPRNRSLRRPTLFDCYHFWSGLNKLEDLDLIRNCRWDWKSGRNSEARGFLTNARQAYYVDNPHSWCYVLQHNWRTFVRST
jgi:hypothetical protein